MSDRIHSIRLALRRPYKIALCCAANILVILFAVIEGVQMTQTRAAMNAAIESRYYTGTLSSAAENTNGSVFYHDTRVLIGTELEHVPSEKEGEER